MTDAMSWIHPPPSARLTVAAWPLCPVNPPAAPSGKIYIGWLVSDDGKTMVNTGAVTVGADGASKLLSVKLDDAVAIAK